MKVDLLQINREDFLVTEHLIGGELCTFVRPRPTFFDWTPDLLHFRSSIWNSKGELISGSFKKFFNLEEKPAIDPFPLDFKHVKVVEKLDGSTLIVSRYNGETIHRTRGTTNAIVTMANGDEIESFRSKYKSFFNFVEAVPTFPFTFLLEWVSDRNKIVLSYPETDLYLLAIVSNADYSLLTQDMVDVYAQELGLKRPKVFNFDTKELMVSTIKELEGYEGVCVYYNHDQHIRKVKAVAYLKLHAFKSTCTFKTIMELYNDLERPTIEIFKDKIEKTFDYECLVQATSIIDLMYTEGVYKVSLMVAQVKDFVDTNKTLDRKAFAIKNIETFGAGSYPAALAFRLLSGADRDLDIEFKYLKHLMELQKDVVQVVSNLETE